MQRQVNWAGDWSCYFVCRYDVVALTLLGHCLLQAKTYNPPFGGAMFPWESGLTGEEVCPSWAATGLREIHING
jgi:hypothetical protein